MLKDITNLLTILGFLIGFGILLLIPVARPAAALGLPNTGGLGEKLIGGQIQMVTLCCNGVKVKVGDPKGGEFLFVPGQSKLYAYYNIFTPGVWVLGTASPIAICQKLLAFPPCVQTESLDGTIKIVGTSSL